MSEKHGIGSGLKSVVENVAETLMEGTAAGVGKEAHAPGHHKVARDLMTTDVSCAKMTDNVSDVARKLTELNIGSMPICGDDDRLHGMITDRDIVTKVVAAGLDPSMTPVGEIAQESTVTVDVDCSIGELLETMSQYQIRRIPVVDDHRLVGIVSQADVARAIAHDQVGNFVEAVSEP